MITNRVLGNTLFMLQNYHFFSVVRTIKIWSVTKFEIYNAVLWTGGSVVKNPPANAGDPRDANLIPGSGRSPGEGNSNPLQYSCLGNPTYRGTWQGTVHGVTKSQTPLSMRTNTNCGL